MLTEPQELFHSPAVDPPRCAEFAHECLHPRKVLVEDRDEAPKAVGPDRVVHELPVFRLCEYFAATELAFPKVLTVTRRIVKENLTNIPFVVAALLCVVAIQEVELSSKPAARYSSFNLRCDYAARTRVSTCITFQKFDEVDVAP